MKELSIKQKQFFTALKDIQEAAVNISLCQDISTVKIEDVLYNVTYETIYSIMELFDGYVDENITLDIIDSNSRESLKRGIQLHDVCTHFIKFRCD